MNNLLSDRIKNASLTKTQRRIADYFLCNQERIGALSSMDIAQEIGVSDASIIRFSRTIGYDGFSDLKNHLYNMLVENAFAGLSLSERMKQSDEKFRGRDTFPQFQNLMLQNLLSTFSSNSMEDFDGIADLLLSSRHRYVIGMRGCKGIAASFSRILGFMLPNVTRLLDGECTSISALQDVGQDDVVLMFVFTRYYKIDIRYLELARKRGSKICLVTNDTAGPLHGYADIALRVSTTNMSFFHSTVGAAIVAEYLLTLISYRTDCRDRIEERDEITKDQRVTAPSNHT